MAYLTQASFSTELRRMMHYFKGEPPRELENILDVASQSERQYSVVITISFGGGLAPVSIRSIIYILPAILLLRLFNKYRSVAPNLSVVVRVIDVSYLTLQVNPELAATDVYRLSNERMAFCQQFVHAHAPDVAARISFVKLHALHEAKHVLLPSQECVDSVLADIEFTAKELDTLKTMAKPRKLTSAATAGTQLTAEQRLALTKYYIFTHLFFHGDYVSEDNVALFSDARQSPDLLLSIGGHAEERFNLFRDKIREHLRTTLTLHDAVLGRNTTFPPLVRMVGKSYGKQPPYMYSDRLDLHLAECQQQALCMDPALLFSTPSEKSNPSPNAIPILCPDEVRMLSYFLISNFMSSFNVHSA